MTASDYDVRLMDYWTEQPVTKFFSYLAYMKDWGVAMESKMKNRI